MEVDRKENTKRFKALDQQNASSNKQQSGALEHIRQRIEDTQQQINTGNAILNQISNTLRLDWLRQLGSELKGCMASLTTEGLQLICHSPSSVSK